MKNKIVKLLLVVGIVLASIAILALVLEVVPLGRFRRAFCALSADDAFYVTAYWADDSTAYATEEVYVSGEDYLWVKTGAENSWQLTRLYKDGNYYTAFSSPEATYPLQQKYGVQEIPLPWMHQTWGDVKKTVKDCSVKAGVLEVICEDEENSIVYSITDGKMSSITYQGPSKLTGESGEDVYVMFKRVFNFRDITHKEVERLLEEYLADVKRES